MIGLLIRRWTVLHCPSSLAGSWLAACRYAGTPFECLGANRRQEGDMIPGEVLAEPGDIELNAGLARTVLMVANTGDRPIQVGSHYHFAETNQALSFDRKAAHGQRLDIAAGTAVRFEPGQ